MLKMLHDRFESVALWFYDNASGVVGGISKALDFPALSSRLARRFSKPTPLLFVELFVALSLSVNFFFLTKPMALPKRDGNMYNAFLFAYLSKSAHAPIDGVQPTWRTRLLAPMVSGWLMDAAGGNLSNAASNEFQNVFGFYHASWLFLLFLALILFRKDALLVMLGVFGGLMYNYTFPAGMYYYPWDMPAMFFFTLACLLYDRRQYGLLLATVYVGSLFRETILCCTLLFLLDGQWPWLKRIGGFLGIFVAAVASTKLLVFHYHVQTGMVAWHAFQTHELFRNVRALFSVQPNHVLFVDAGSLFPAMLLPWRSRRDIVLKMVMLAFIAGQFLYGLNTEIRVWYELFPLGWMLLSEGISDWRQKMAGVSAAPQAAIPAQKTGVQMPAESAPVLAGRVLRGSYWLMLALLFILALGIFGLAEIKPPPPAPSLPDDLDALKARAQSGDADAAYKLGVLYQQSQDEPDATNWFQIAAQLGNRDAENVWGASLAARQDYTNAAEWLQRAVDQGDPNAEINLATLYTYGFGVKQNAAAAAALLEKADRQGDAPGVEVEYKLGLIYEQNQDYTNAALWLKKAALQGNRNAENTLGALLATRQDYPDAVPWLQRAVKQGDPNAEINLANLYLHGYGVKVNGAAAAALFEKAARQGDAPAQLFLGQLYEKGEGVKQDYIAAYKWFKLAQMQRIAGADKELNKCSLSMTPGQIASAEKQAGQFQPSKP